MKEITKKDKREQRRKRKKRGYEKERGKEREISHIPNRQCSSEVPIPLLSHDHLKKILSPSLYLSLLSYSSPFLLS